MLKLQPLLPTASFIVLISFFKRYSGTWISFLAAFSETSNINTSQENQSFESFTTIYLCHTETHTCNTYFMKYTTLDLHFLLTE